MSSAAATQAFQQQTGWGHHDPTQSILVCTPTGWARPRAVLDLLRRCPPRHRWLVLATWTGHGRTGVWTLHGVFDRRRLVHPWCPAPDAPAASFPFTKKLPAPVPNPAPLRDRDRPGDGWNLHQVAGAVGEADRLLTHMRCHVAALAACAEGPDPAPPFGDWCYKLKSPRDLTQRAFAVQFLLHLVPYLGLTTSPSPRHDYAAVRRRWQTLERRLLRHRLHGAPWAVLRHTVDVLETRAQLPPADRARALDDDERAYLTQHTTAFYDPDAHYRSVAWERAPPQAVARRWVLLRRGRALLSPPQLVEYAVHLHQLPELYPRRRPREEWPQARVWVLRDADHYAQELWRLCLPPELSSGPSGFSALETKSPSSTARSGLRTPRALPRTSAGLPRFRLPVLADPRQAAPCLVTLHQDVLRPGPPRAGTAHLKFEARVWVGQVYRHLHIPPQRAIVPWRRRWDRATATSMLSYWQAQARHALSPTSPGPSCLVAMQHQLCPLAKSGRLPPEEVLALCARRLKLPDDTPPYPVVRTRLRQAQAAPAQKFST